MTNREIDALVATHIMGWVYQHDVWYSPEYKTAQKFDCPPRYSTEIAAAWQVVKKLCDAPAGVMDLQITYSRSNGWYVEIGCGTCSDRELSDAPMVICLAALKALGVEVPQE